MGTLTYEAIRAAIFDVVGGIAPEFDPDGVDPRASLREQVDLDSFDFLNVIIGLHERLGIEIPEADYGKLGTLDEMIEYLAGHAT